MKTFFLLLINLAIMSRCFANKIINTDQLSNVSKLDISGFDSVEIINGDRFSAEISATDIDLADIQFHQNKNEFKIQYSSTKRKHERLVIKVFVPENYQLDYMLSNNGNVVTASNSIFSHLNLYVTSIGSIVLSSTCDDFVLKGASIGNLKMDGRSLKADITLKNVSNIDCSQMTIKELNINFVNVAQGNFYVSDKVSGQATNCSKVIIAGQPQNKNILKLNSREIIYK